MAGNGLFARTGALQPATYSLPPSPQERLDAAVAGLENLDPALSAKSGLWPLQRIALNVIALTALAAIFFAPAVIIVVLHAAFAVVFAMLLSVRVLAIHHALTKPSAAGLFIQNAIRDDGALPTYTVLIALHAEVPVVPQLVAALRALDYPHDKLDVVFALEADDLPTQAALFKEGLPAHMRLVVVPEGLPRTKPRALCYGLTFARGEYIVVYDAEDLPAPDQLRCAAGAFAAGGGDLGCLQASLAINNSRHSWLTAQFAIEYTALFDAILPALARHGLPVPLGGTSNHFPRRALHDVGGWDPFNVTEDADLGLRLARFGWRVDVLASTTWEEAPPAWRPWLAQRTRWQKGWMQTYFVHMREPARLWHDLGPASWAWFQIVLGGGLISALAHPWFYALLVWQGFNGGLFPALANGAAAWLWWFGIANLAAAALATIALALITLERRGRRDLFVYAVFSPLYWLLVSYAAYRAIFEWRRAPFFWAKTPHGAAICEEN